MLSAPYLRDGRQTFVAFANPNLLGAFISGTSVFLLLTWECEPVGEDLLQCLWVYGLVLVNLNELLLGL